MKLIAILFLCSRLLPSLTQEEVPQEIDCNDADVFLAVDVALKKYNAGNQSGNQFLLYRVTEGTKTVGSETFYFIKYQIKEGNCSVQSGLTWQDCDFKDAEEAATGECTATVKKRRTKFSLATQTCKITPGNGPIVTAEYTCLGCVYPISTDNPELQPILKHAVEHFNNNTKHSHLFALEEVKAAQRQVVAGVNFEVTYSLVQTNCSKKDFLLLTPECKSLPNGDAGECRDSAFVDIKQKIVHFSQNCELYPGEDLVQPLPEDCPGCPKKIPVDSPELTEALGHAITKLNTDNSHSFYFKIDTVKKATSQVVAGMKYFIEFIARETECSKESNTELTANCEVKPAGQSLNCKANVYMRPWENKVEPTVNCRALETIEPLPENCPGCPKNIPVDSPELTEALGHAITKLNTDNSHSFYFKIDTVKKATSQVVAGMKYFIEFIARETECSKESNTELTANCEVKPAGQSLNCKANVYMRPWENKVEPTVNCRALETIEPLPENCPGCPKNIPVDSPELTEALGHAITKLNTDNSHSFYFKIDTVKKATSQVVAGMKYFIEFIARETECSKESNTELTANCEVKPAGQSLNCKANVYMRPWENKVEPTVNCQALEMITMLRRPPGFSPFRSVHAQETKGTTRRLNCEYKGRPSGAGAESAPGSKAESSHLAQ